MARKAYWDQRREKFAVALASGMPVGEAGASVGYSPANSSRNAGRDDVKRRVAELRAPALAKVAEAVECNIEWATERLAAIANAAEEKSADKIGAIRLLAQMYGWLAPDKHEVTGKVASIDPSTLTDEQLRNLEFILATAVAGSGKGGTSTQTH